MFDYKRHLPHDLNDVTDLSSAADRLGIKYFMPVVNSLQFGMRGPIVPKSAIRQVQQNGCNYHGLVDFDMNANVTECYLIPDPDTLIQCPWKKEVGFLQCFMYFEGEISSQCPRTTLIKQIEAAKDQNIEFKVGTELEFTLLKSNKFEGLEDEGTTFYEHPIAQLKKIDFIGEIMDYMDELGWGPYHAEHESSANQFEINYGYTNALESMDRLQFLKFMIKAVAQERGFRATFMPLPFDSKESYLGNGLHVNMSIWNHTTQENIITDKSQELGLSKVGQHFLGGLMAHLKSLTALGCPTVNSYKRLNFLKNSWNTVSYGLNTRFPAIRIAQNNKVTNRLEIRFPDPSSNAYLLMAAIISASLHGITKELLPNPEHQRQEDAFTTEFPKDVEELPVTLDIALKELQSDELLMSDVGIDIVKAFIVKKKDHFADMMKEVTPKEIDLVDMY